jgi:hypothetical protein
MVGLRMRWIWIEHELDSLSCLSGWDWRLGFAKEEFGSTIMGWYIVDHSMHIFWLVYLLNGLPIYN